MVDPIAEFVDPTPESLQAAWESVLLREDLGAARQMNFIPCEVVLFLCASLFVDHRKFGSSSAHRPPALILDLARLFKRPPSSILAKMANLDGSRSNGGRYDQDVALLLLPSPEDWQRLYRVYRRILRSARAAGIGPDQLMDFWDPLSTPSQAGKSSLPVGNVDLVPQPDDVRWFDGVNGQVILADEYIWITRENLADDCRWGLSTEPRRAPRAALVMCQLDPASTDQRGSIHLRVEGAPPVPANCNNDENAVTFDWGQSAEFEELYELLTESDDADEGRSPTERQFVRALDALGGVATLDELVRAMLARAATPQSDESYQQLTADLEECDNDEYSTWEPFHPAGGDEVWVAVGGSRITEVEFRDHQLVALRKITTVLRMDSTREDLVRAAQRVGLQGVAPDRLMSLWTRLASGPVVPAVEKPRSEKPRTGNPAARPPTMPPTAHRQRPTGVSSPAATRPVAKPGPPQRAASAKMKPGVVGSVSQPTLHIRKMNSPSIGEDFRVHMLCDGMETIARYYSRTGRVKIVKGTLKGEEFADPHVAAAAVIERDTPGHGTAADGWIAWRLKGGPDLPLGSVRNLR